MSNFRYRIIERGHNMSLTAHELEELERDYCLSINGLYAVATLTKKQFDSLDLKQNEIKKIRKVVDNWNTVRGWKLHESALNDLVEELYEASEF